MTPQLKAAVRKLGLTGLAFAALTGVANTTVSGWGRKQRRDRAVQQEPIWTWHLVRAWQQHPHLLLEAVTETHAIGGAGRRRRAMDRAIDKAMEQAADDWARDQEGPAQAQLIPEEPE